MIQHCGLALSVLVEDCGSIFLLPDDFLKHSEVAVAMGLQLIAYQHGIFSHQRIHATAVILPPLGYMLEISWEQP
jgi:hypothetical protein